MSAIAAFLPPAAQARDAIRILALGDSLISGYGLPEADGFPTQLERALAAKGVAARVLNGGVAGDTSAAGLARLDWALADRPDLVILEFGANDGLRGLDPAATRDNIAAMLARLARDRIPVLLAGMKAPRNLGPDYVAAFDPIYEDLAREYHVAFVPFFLDGIAGEPALNQADGIHPNAAGVAKIVQRLLPNIMALLAVHIDGGAG
jgi:acyl-CoA thioesterase-1